MTVVRLLCLSVNDEFVNPERGEGGEAGSESRVLALLLTAV